MKYEIWSRPVHVKNTDPQRRCYWGCNFSEETFYGDWELFQTWDTLEFAKAVVCGLKCSRYEYKIKETANE